MAPLSGKVAIVTGASRGIGLATASALVDAGARVVISARNQSALDHAVRALGAATVGVSADVRNPDDVTKLFDAAVAAFGGLDILVNNAGVGMFHSVETTLLEQWRDVIDTNLTGAFLCTQRALPLMRTRGGGWIINISSRASKAALNAFTDALLQEVRHDGIRVASILPGSVRTEFMARAKGTAAAPTADDAWKLAPEDVAQAVMALLAHPARSLPSRVEIRPAQPVRRS
jgi:3-oxoacyl-[acyl-carrier protein] reductase